MYNRYMRSEQRNGEETEYQSCFHGADRDITKKHSQKGLLDGLRALLPKSLDTSDLLLILILVLLLIEDEDDEILIILLMTLLGG